MVFRQAFAASVRTGSKAAKRTFCQTTNATAASETSVPKSKLNYGRIGIAAAGTVGLVGTGAWYWYSSKPQGNIFVTQAAVCELLKNPDEIDHALAQNQGDLKKPDVRAALLTGMGVPLYFSKKSLEFRTLAKDCEIKALSARVAGDTDGEKKWYAEYAKYLRYANAFVKLQYSPHKETKKLNTSVTAGIATSMGLKPGQKVCILNGGGGQLRAQLYVVTEHGVEVVGEHKPQTAPSVSSLIIPSSKYVPPKDKDGKSVVEQKSTEVLLPEIENVLKTAPAEWNLKEVPTHLMITGFVRNYYEKASADEKQAMDKFVNETLCTKPVGGFQIKPWNGVTNSCFISPAVEGQKENLAVKALNQSLDPTCKCVGSLGVGNSSSQFGLTLTDEKGNEETKVLEFPNGMKEYTKLAEFPQFLEKAFSDPVVLAGFVTTLEKSDKPVIGWKSGVLLPVKPVMGLFKCQEVN
jgi:hypothetical protein